MYLLAERVRSPAASIDASGLWFDKTNNDVKMCLVYITRGRELQDFDDIVHKG